MTKGLRFPQNAIVDGQFGTARVRGYPRPNKSLDALEADGASSVTAAIAKLVGDASTNASRETHRALGRLPNGRMNKTEHAYAQHLDAQRIAGNVLWFKFEGHKLRLADRTFFTPDFTVMLADGRTEYHEVKGFMEEDANVKIKVAAEQFPYTFRLVRRGKHGTWDIREVRACAV